MLAVCRPIVPGLQAGRGGALPPQTASWVSRSSRRWLTRRSCCGRRRRWWTTSSPRSSNQRGGRQGRVHSHVYCAVCALCAVCSTCACLPASGVRACIRVCVRAYVCGCVHVWMFLNWRISPWLSAFWSTVQSRWTDVKLPTRWGHRSTFLDAWNESTVTQRKMVPRAVPNGLSVLCAYWRQLTPPPHSPELQWSPISG